METLVINRKKWLHGEGGGRSYLLREKDGKMCCLGFRALQCGATKKQIMGIKTPDELFRERGVRLKGLVRSKKTCTPAGTHLMNTNDGLQPREGWAHVENSAREAEIIKAFRKLGVSVKFIGKY